jgi:hypothetical protein
MGVSGQCQAPGRALPLEPWNRRLGGPRELVGTHSLEEKSFGCAAVRTLVKSVVDTILTELPQFQLGECLKQ